MASQGKIKIFEGVGMKKSAQHVFLVLRLFVTSLNSAREDRAENTSRVRAYSLETC